MSSRRRRSLAIMLLGIVPSILLATRSLAQTEDSGQISQDGAVELRDYINSSGVEWVDNQNDLMRFQVWINRLPGLLESGYSYSIDDSDTRTKSLVWASDHPILAESIDREAAQRSISVKYLGVPFGKEAFDLAATTIFDWLHVEYPDLTIGAISEPQVEDPIQRLTVSVFDIRDPDKYLSPERLSLIQQRVEGLALGVPVKVDQGLRGTPVARNSDFRPFNAGGYMIDSSAGSTCTAGFQSGT